MTNPVDPLPRVHHDLRKALKNIIATAQSMDKHLEAMERPDTSPFNHEFDLKFSELLGDTIHLNGLAEEWYDRGDHVSEWDNFEARR